MKPKKIEPIHKRRKQISKECNPLTSRQGESKVNDLRDVSINHEYNAWHHKNVSNKNLSPFQCDTTLSKNLISLQEAVLVELKFMLSIVINSRYIPYPLVESCLLKFMKYQNAVASSLCRLDSRLRTKTLKASQGCTYSRSTQTSISVLDEHDLSDEGDEIESSDEQKSNFSKMTFAQAHFQAAGVGKVLAKIDLSLRNMQPVNGGNQDNFTINPNDSYGKVAFKAKKKEFFSDVNSNLRAVDCIKEVVKVISLETLTEIEISKLLHQFTKLLEGLQFTTFSEDSNARVYAERSMNALKRLLPNETDNKPPVLKVTFVKSTQTDKICEVDETESPSNKERMKSKSSPLLKQKRTPMSIPWGKFMQPSKTKKKKKKEAQVKVRKLEISAIRNTFISEIYMKKAIMESENTSNGKKKRKSSLAKLVTFYFTQKYGLKKLADEYVISLIHYIRENENSKENKSNRISLFGKLLGVVNPDDYDIHIANSIVQALTLCFRQEVRQIGPKMSQGEYCTFVLVKDAINCIKKMFLSLPTCKLRDEDEEGGYYPQTDTNIEVKVCTLPHSFKTDIFKWLEHNSKKLSDLKASSEHKLGKKVSITGGRELAVDVDEFLDFVYQVLLKKSILDRVIFEELFLMYDFDGNGVLSFDEFTCLLESFQGSNFNISQGKQTIDLIEAGMIRESDALDIKSKFPDEPFTEDDILEVWDEVNDLESDDNDDAIEQSTFSYVCAKRGFQLPYWKLGYTMISNLNDIPLSVNQGEIQTSIRFCYEKLSE